MPGARHKGAAGTSARAADYGILTVNSPGVTKVMTPPQMQFRVETLSSEG